MLRVWNIAYRDFSCFGVSMAHFPSSGVHFDNPMELQRRYSDYSFKTSSNLRSKIKILYNFLGPSKFQKN